MACTNYCVSSFPPDWLLYPNFSGRKAPSPCHHPTYAQASHRRVADGMGQDWDRNCDATLHCTSMLPAPLEFPKAGSPALCPAQAAPLPGHNPLQGCWAPSEQGTALLITMGDFTCTRCLLVFFVLSPPKGAGSLLSTAQRWPQEGLGSRFCCVPADLCWQALSGFSCKRKADPFGVWAHWNYISPVPQLKNNTTLPFVSPFLLSSSQGFLKGCESCNNSLQQCFFSICAMCWTLLNKTFTWRAQKHPLRCTHTYSVGKRSF